MTSMISTSTIIIVNLAAGILGFLLSLTISYLVWRFCCFSANPIVSAAKKKINNKKKTDKDSYSGLVRVSLFQEPVEKLVFADLMTATTDFSSDHVVVAGNSSLGTSYKAVLRDGSALIVKRLNECTLARKKFWAETSRIGRIRHPNLASLLGFCFVDERLLIYKNMVNGALSSRLQSEEDECLDWPTRLRIGIGAARGLAWLHHGFDVPFSHQNLSSRVVLLDEDYETRITEFGICSLLRPSMMSPLSIKGDVYEFGVVLLELATDQTAPETSNDITRGEFNRNLVDWTFWLSAAGRTTEAIGQSLRGRGQDDQIVEFLNVACKCVAALPELRPSMYQVYESLKSIGGRQEFSVYYDEFPLLYNRIDLEPAKLVN